MFGLHRKDRQNMTQGLICIRGAFASTIFAIWTSISVPVS